MLLTCNAAPLWGLPCASYRCNCRSGHDDVLEGVGEHGDFLPRLIRQHFVPSSSTLLFKRILPERDRTGPRLLTLGMILMSGQLRPTCRSTSPLPWMPPRIGVTDMRQTFTPHRTVQTSFDVALWYYDWDQPLPPLPPQSPSPPSQ